MLRHTAVIAVGGLAGYPVAQAFAGHAPTSVTGRYLHAGLADVATAVATLTGQTHPLAERRVESSAAHLGVAAALERLADGVPLVPASR